MSSNDDDDEPSSRAVAVVRENHPHPHREDEEEEEEDSELQPQPQPQQPQDAIIVNNNNNNNNNNNSSSSNDNGNDDTTTTTTTPTNEDPSVTWWVYRGGTVQDTSVLRDATHVRIDDAALEELPDRAFVHSPHLQCVHITARARLGKIGYQAFYKCPRLTSVQIDNASTTTTTTHHHPHWQSLGHGALGDCPRLQTFRVPYGIRRLEPFTLAYGRSLTTIDLPFTLTSLGHSALAYCSALTRLTLPLLAAPPPDQNTVTTTSTSSIAATHHRGGGKGTHAKSLPAPLLLLRIGKHALAHCTALTHLQLPATGRRVVWGQEVLTGCTSLQSLEFVVQRRRQGSQEDGQGRVLPSLDQNDNGTNTATATATATTVMTMNHVTVVELACLEQCATFRSLPLEKYLGIPSESPVKPTLIYTFLRCNLWRLPMGSTVAITPTGSATTTTKDKTIKKNRMKQRQARKHHQNGRNTSNMNTRQNSSRQRRRGWSLWASCLPSSSPP